MSSAVDSLAFRQTVGRFATGVTVVSVVVDGVPHGMTSFDGIPTRAARVSGAPLLDGVSPTSTAG